MSTETNKAIVSRYIEQVWNKGRLDLTEEFFVEDVFEHGAPQIPGLNGRDSLKTIIGGARTSFPDVNLALHDVIAEGDKVVTRWTMQATHQGEFMGIPATGNQITTSGGTIYRLDNARIVEIWNFADNLSMMQQLGVVPTPGAA